MELVIRMHSRGYNYLEKESGYFFAMDVTIIRIVSFGDIFERNYRGIRFAVECIY